jgi:hypothetical protein
MRGVIHVACFCVTFWENEDPEMQNPPRRAGMRKSVALGGLQISRNRRESQGENPVFANGDSLRLFRPFAAVRSTRTERISMSAIPAHLRPRREKVFGEGRPLPLDRNAKVRIVTLARSLTRRTAKGKAYGAITAKALAVLEALLFGFHNAKSGLCFPSLETIAEKAGCARSTVAEAIKALEDAGLLTWVNRIDRIRECAPDLFGQWATRWRVIRRSNGYRFNDPAPCKTPVSLRQSSKSEKPTGTTIQDSSLNNASRSSLVFDLSKPVEASLARWFLATQGQNQQTA